MPPQLAWWSVSKKCALCGTGTLLVKQRRDGTSKFVGCSNYPQCGYTRNFIQPNQEQQLSLMASLEEERDSLRREVEALRARAGGLEPGLDTPVAVLRRRLLQLAKQFHPDVNKKGLDPTEVTRELLRLREDVEKASGTERGERGERGNNNGN